MVTLNTARCFFCDRQTTGGDGVTRISDFTARVGDHILRICSSPAERLRDFVCVSVTPLIAQSIFDRSGVSIAPPKTPDDDDFSVHQYLDPQTPRCPLFTVLTGCLLYCLWVEM